MAVTIQQVVEESKASQGKLELFELLTKVSEIYPEVIVEIGAWRGYSLHNWLKMFPGTTVVGVEYDEPTFSLLSEYTKSIDFKGELILMCNDSLEAKTAEILRTQLQGKQIDFLFIDGDHAYKAVKRDFELYSPLVKKGGIIAFHDADLRDHPTVEVYKFWDELVTQHADHTYIIPSQDGTGVGILYKE